MRNRLFSFVMFIALLYLLSGCRSSKQAKLTSVNLSDIQSLTSNTDTLHLLIKEIGLKSPVPLSENDTLDINMGNEGKSYRLILQAGPDSLPIVYKGKSKENAIIKRNDKTLLVNINYGGGEAIFPKKYRLTYDGKVHIEFPKVYELMNIVFAISELEALYPGKVNKNSSYFNQVNKNFETYGSHPLIELINHKIENDYSFYRNLRANSYAYVFDGEEIVPKGLYTRISEGPNLLEELIPSLQDFASKSNFLMFYESNTNYYNNIANDFETKIPVLKMWQWLEKHFSKKVNSYKIVLSPLAGNHQFTMNFEDRDYIENLMFNSAVELKGLSEENLGNISRSIFTEIDHNYVNPTSNLFRQQILKAIPDYKIWNNSSSYASSIKTFNEYMTWATFTLFAREYFDLAVFNRVNANTELIMVKSRGFLKFNDFNQELLRLFNDRAKDQTVSNLYPKIISWMEKQGH